MNQFEGIFELFDCNARRLANGNKLRIILECPENLETEKTLIDFRGEYAKTLITQSVKPENNKDVILIEDVFEIYDVKCRRLRNGNKTCIILENLHTKENEIKGVSLRFDDVKIHLEKMDKDLFEKKQNESNDEPEIEDPEGDK